MNDSGHRQQRTGADDQALGAALGDAVGRQADSPVATPPVADIAERAAARVRARRIRHSAVGVAAAAALIAGGVTAWNALDAGGDVGHVRVAAAPAGNSPAPAAPQPPDQPAGGVDHTAGAEDSPDGSGSSGPDPTSPTPGELSTGPTLVWAEVAPGTRVGPTDLHGIESVGDGRIVARASGDAGGRLFVTTDGTTWSAIGLPDGVSPDHLDVASRRWVVAGADPTAPDHRDRVFHSDDDGTTWTELAIDIDRGTEPLPSYCIERTRVRSVAASGDRIVVVIDDYTDIDPHALPAAPDPAPDRGSTPQGSPPPDAAAPEPGEIVHDAAWSDGRILPPCLGPVGTHGERVHVLLSDDTGIDRVAEYHGSAISAVGTADGFSVTVRTVDGVLLLTSTDGRTWASGPLAGDGHSHAARGPDGAVWRSGYATPYRIEQSTVGAAPRTVATFDRVLAGEAFAAGPAGVVAEVTPLSTSEVDSASPARIARGGYEARLDEPPGGLTLWDLDNDVAVHEMGPDALAGGTLPAGVRTIENEDGSVAVVFQDPDSGEELVRFDAEELASAVEQSIVADGYGTLLPTTWIGWSADGSRWGWQDAPDAFGLDSDGANLWVELAVGEDFVLARVVTPAAVDVPGPDGTTEMSRLPPSDSVSRWFIARVP